MANEITTTNGTDLVLSQVMPADQNAALVYLAGLTSEHSRRTMGNALATVAGVLTGTQEEYRGRLVYKYNPGSIEWGRLRFQHVALVRSVLAGEFSPASANKLLSALRGVLKAAWRLEQMPTEAYHRAVDFDRVEGETLPAGRHISAGELWALLDACVADPSPAGVRDAAIIGLLYSCGLRRAELAALDVADFDREAGSLVVRGKRRKEREIPVVNGAEDALLDWLDVRGLEPGPLFVPVRRGGHIKLSEGRMTTQAVYAVLSRRAKQAGVSDVSPHDFRRTFVSDLLDAGADIVTVQKLAGHANVDTTSRYDRRDEKAKRRAAEMLHIPYRRRRK